MEIKRKVGSILLLTALLFGQLAVNFLHSIHNEHASSKLLPLGQAGVSQHGEHCKICAIDFVRGILHEAVLQLTNPLKTEIRYQFSQTESDDFYFSFTQGRAPPIGFC